MKMNVKGLVFVGFAAAVFASAANAAGDKIVTSKTYVDSKITQNIGTSTTTAPSENAVKEALALKKDSADVGAAAAKGVDTDFTNPASTDLPTTAAVATYVSSQVSTAGGNYQTKSTTAQQVSDGAGGWTNLSMDTTPTANSTKPVTSGGVAAALGDYTKTTDLGTMASEAASDYTKTANLATVATSGSYNDLSNTPDLTVYQTVANKTTTVAATGSTSNDKYPTETAVRAAITAAAGDYATAAQGALADTAVQPGNLATVATTGAYTDLSGTPDLTVYQTVANKTTTVAATGSTSNDKYPTETAVRAAITAAAGDYATAAQGTTADSAIQSVKVNGSALTPDANKAVDVTVPVLGVQVNGSDLTPDSTTKKVNVTVPTTVASLSDAGNYQLTANMSSNMTSDTGSTTKYPTVAAVQSYVTGLNNNLNLPANNTAEGTACDANNPCALVWSGTGQPEWKRIQQ